MEARVLIIDDDQDMCVLLEKGLRGWGFRVQWLTSADEALDLLLAEDFSAVVTDLNMPGLNGVDFCQRVAKNRPDLPVLVITAFGSMETAIASIRAGAYDFITKPFDLETLALALERAVVHRNLKDEVKRLREAIARTDACGNEIIGSSTAMKKVYDLLKRMSENDASVLIMGESGTGKELIARALHRQSSRNNKPFLAVNCAALPLNLLESEFFGHVKGAFTDARSTKQGIFVQANGGTVLLDEIGELPLELQPKLLRALQERSVRPIGGTHELPFDVRLIAATNQDLAEMVTEGAFREDLYYRLNVVPIYLPPLRERHGDIPMLATAFLGRYCKRNKVPMKSFTPEAMARLESCRWPGNVRELRNIVERVAILCDSDNIELRHLPPEIRDTPAQSSVTQLPRSWDDFKRLKQEVRDAAGQELERRFLIETLQRSGGNVSRAAEDVGMQRTNFHALMRRYGLSSDTVS